MPRENPDGQDRQFASTLARGLEVLRAFTPERPVLGNAELAQRTGMSKPTISRFTYTLQQLGYLQQERETGRYRLGSAVLTIAYPLLANIPLRQVVRASMRKLADKLGGSVSLGMRDRLDIVYVETSRSRSPSAQRYSDIGMSHPIIAGSNGRAYLAALSPDERSALMNEIRVKTPEAYRKFQSRAMDAVEDWRRLGFCFSYGDYRHDVCTVGVPYRHETRGELFVFNCVLAASAVKQGQLEAEIGPQLVEMVGGLSG
ncbi:IclR family transcriptional regulator [Ramlibacter algicola]|jgi:DNA-binding IclR family transcriptional regulator|uniref:IclR family transcriptional regulator n=1 Tax=Ramlibacter algicola TaxID=2795217 RepID=A0A934Q0A7_9BURK|nr:IclR family transcriptional regulator [Ramlibacter algicola]MBK0393709.1 IclR family transcriptional regulator [Ramlibacter algicola]